MFLEWFFDISDENVKDLSCLTYQFHLIEEGKIFGTKNCENVNIFQIESVTYI